MHRPALPPLLSISCLLLACGGPSATTTSGTDTDPTSTGSTTGDTTTVAPTTDPPPTTTTTTAPTTTVGPTTGTTTGTTTTGPDPTTGTTGTTDPTDTDTDTTTEGCRADCGNGIVGCDEACDDGPDNSDVVQGACRTDCSLAGCGDSVVDYTLSEQCDDGNLEDGDGCSAACQLEPLGADCGDGAQDPLEVCDDGNSDNSDSCNPTCNLTNETSVFVGTQGMLGLQDGVGTDALISGTGGLAVDLSYLYLADAQNNCIRRIEISSATVETIAGAMNGQSGYVDDPNGLAARFAGLEAIASDGKTLWVADGPNRRLRAVELTPPFAVTTVAGSGVLGVEDGVGDGATFDDLRGLTYYQGFVYMLDASAGVLRRFDPATQEVVTLAGQAYMNATVDGVGAAAQFVSPRAMTSDNSGMLYIADTNGFHIRSFNTVTNYVGTFAGDGVQGYTDAVGAMASIHRPRGMTSDGTSIYFAEFNQHTVRQGVLATGEVSTNAGQHCGGGMNCPGGYFEGVGVEARFNGPFALAFHPPTSSLFVLDSANRVIRRLQ